MFNSTKTQLKVENNNNEWLTINKKSYITFHRTLRIPKRNKNIMLTPLLGNLSVFWNNGRYEIPLSNSEAFTISIYKDSNDPSHFFINNKELIFDEESKFLIADEQWTLESKEPIRIKIINGEDVEAFLISPKNTLEWAGPKELLAYPKLGEEEYKKHNLPWYKYYN